MFETPSSSARGASRLRGDGIEFGKWREQEDGFRRTCVPTERLCAGAAAMGAGRCTTSDENIGRPVEIFSWKCVRLEMKSEKSKSG
jgi:hypothetical protein